jgi:predicted Fe-S protein YdhL (DUF1289 family)
MTLLLPDNPCVSLCELDDHGVCLGCGRTKQEIKSWKTLADTQRHDVNMRLLATGRKKVRRLLLKRLRQRIRHSKA